MRRDADRRAALSATRVARAAAESGLVFRGGFAVGPEDEIADLVEGRPAVSLLLFGHAGASIWPFFSRSAEYLDARPDPMNRWSARMAEALAAEFHALPLYPFGGPPYRPFLRWAHKAETLEPSPLGLLLHPEYGLWHAYRFALAFSRPIADLAPPAQRTNICARCQHRSCLQSCPVNAFDGQRYAVAACTDYLASHPHADCHTRGCRARTACPEGAAFHYPPAQAAFHIAQFLTAQTRP